ncbi:uncharacterized protein F5891DRAFT_964496, partial [Suillus fuscotomentosus]
SYALFSTPSAEVETTQLQIRKDTNAVYDAPTQSAMQKATKDAQGLEKKRLKGQAEEREAKEKAEKRERRLQDSKNIVLTEDPSLPQSVKSKIVKMESLRGQRVRVSGWVHRRHDQQEIMFIVLWDGTGYLQAVLTGNAKKTYDAVTLQLEASAELTGMLKTVHEGQRPPGGHELVVDSNRLDEV